MADYWVVTKTGEIDGGGTDADVEIKLSGTGGETEWIILDEELDDRERGDVNIYIIKNATDVGEVQRVLVRAREESAEPDGPRWYLDRVSVIKGDAPEGALLCLARGGVSGTPQRRRPPLQKFSRQGFEDAFRQVARVFSYDGWITPGKFASRGSPYEWAVVELR